MPIWKESASAVNGETPGIAIEEVPLRKRNPGWSASFLIENSLEFNKEYKSMEQLLAYQPCDLCMGFIDAAAAEKLSQRMLGVSKAEGITKKDAFNLGITPLRPSEAPILKVTPAGALEKCKWHTTIDGSSEKEEASTTMDRHIMLRRHKTRSEYGSLKKPVFPPTSDAARRTCRRPTTSLEWETMRMGIQLESSCARPVGTMQSKWPSVPME
jgi:hypothetical protein